MAKALNRRVSIYINGKEVENTLKSLRSELRHLENQQRTATIGSEEYIATTKKIAELKAYLREQTGSLREVERQWDTTTESASRYGNIVTGLRSAFQMIRGGVDSLRQFTDEAARMDDVYADVRKTTGLTTEEVGQLNERFKQMDTRTPREQLNELAAAAGKLGITGVENLTSFVSAADKIRTALGADLGADATTVIGKMAEVYTSTTAELEGQDLGTKMLRIGSAINSLGMASTAAEPHMVDFLARLGGMGAQAGLSATQVLGYASALDQAGVSVEKSATAFQNFMAKMMQKPAEFAEIARMETSRFADLMATDMDAAIKAVLSGLNEEGGMTRLAPIFKDLQLSGSGVTTMLTTLKGSIEKVNEAQAIANEQMATGASIEEEFNTKNTTMQARLEKAKDTFHNTAETLGNALSPAMLTLTNATSGLMQGASSLIKLLQSNKAILPALVVSLAALNRARLLSLATTAKEKIDAVIRLTRQKASKAATLQQAAAESRHTQAIEKGRLELVKAQIATAKKTLADTQAATTTEALNLRTQTQTRLVKLERIAKVQATVAEQAHARAVSATRAAFAATPWGAIITALTAIGTALYTSYQNATRTSRAIKEAQAEAAAEAATIKTLIDRLAAASVGSQQYNDALAELKRQYPDLIAKHIDEEGHIKNLAAAYDELTQSARDSIFARVRSEKTAEAAKDAAATVQKAIDNILGSLDAVIEQSGQQSNAQAIKQEMTAIVAEIENGSLNYQKAQQRFAEIRSKYNLRQREAPAMAGSMPGTATAARQTSFSNIESQLGKITAAYATYQKTVATYEAALGKADPFNLQTKNLGQLQEELTTTQRRIASYQRAADSGRDGFAEKLANEQAHAEALQKAIEKLQSAKKSSTNELISGTTSTPDTPATDRQTSDLQRVLDAATGWMNRFDQQLAASTGNEAAKAAQKWADKIKEVDEQMQALQAALSTASAADQEKIKALLDRYHSVRRDFVSEMTQNLRLAIGEATGEETLPVQIEPEIDGDQIAAELESIIANADPGSGFAQWSNYKEWADKNLTQMQSFGQQATQLWGSINTIMNNQDQARLAEDKKRMEERIDYLDNQLSEGLISQEEYDEVKQALQDEYNDKEKEANLKAWKRQKALNLGQATMDGALAVLKALADGGPILGPILAGIMTALAAAQIAAIATEPEPYARGGYVPTRTVYQAGEKGREWVASNALLTDTTTAPIISALEAYQRGNTSPLNALQMVAADTDAANTASLQIGRATAGENTAMLGMAATMTDLAAYLKDPANRQAIISRQTMTDFDRNETYLRNRARL